MTQPNTTLASNAVGVGCFKLGFSPAWLSFLPLGVIHHMKVKTQRSSVEKLIKLLDEFDASIETFLDELPTPEKYAILGMALVVRGEYEDYEIAVDESMHKVSAQDLTKHLIKFPDLSCHLQDALKLKWSYFEVLWTNDEDEED